MANRVHSAVDATPRRHDDDRERVIQFLYATKHAQTLATRSRVAGIVEVDENHVERLALDGRNDDGNGMGGLDAVAGALEQEAQGLDDVRLVVSYEDGGHSVSGGVGSLSEYTAITH